jgi:hypothetical protein
LTQVNRRVWIRAHDRLIDSLIHVAFAAATVDRKYSSRGGGMGIDMQIVYLGFAGSAEIESEAAAQLVRLERFGRCISGCHLALEAIRRHAGYDVPGARPDMSDNVRDQRLFDARLDLVLRTGELVPIEHRQSSDADEAVRAAFDAAERFLGRRVARA